MTYLQTATVTGSSSELKSVLFVETQCIASLQIEHFSTTANGTVTETATV